jgi:hypothetical protein
MVQSHFVSASLVVLLAGGCGLTEDSRCPSGVSWVWAGDAVVPIAVVDSTGRTTRLELHTNTSFDTAASVDDLSVHINELRTRVNAARAANGLGPFLLERLYT